MPGFVEYKPSKALVEPQFGLVTPTVSASIAKPAYAVA